MNILLMIPYLEKCSALTKRVFFGKDTTLPEPAWKATDVIKMIILTGIILYAVMYGGMKIALWHYGELAVGEFFDYSTDEGKQNLSILLIFGMAFQIMVEMALLYFYSKWKYNITFEDFGFRRTSVRHTFFLGMFLFLSVYFLEKHFTNILEFIPGFLNLDFSFYNDSASETLSLKTIVEEKMIPNWVLIVFAGLVAPVTEEVIFRGYLLPSVMKHMGYVWGVVIASAIFALVHMVFEPMTLLIMFLLGCMLSVMYIRTKSLWPGIIFHSINNTIGTVLAISGIEKLAQ